MKKVFYLTTILLFSAAFVACANNNVEVPEPPAFEIVQIESLSEINQRGADYFHGNGVEQSNEQAVYWYRQAAEQGYALAQDNLGWMYGTGTGVPRDDEQAVYWFRQAAEQGFANAQNNLGMMYQRGIGVEQDYEQAIHWFRQAGAQEHEAARESLLRLLQQED